VAAAFVAHPRRGEVGVAVSRGVCAGGGGGGAEGGGGGVGVGGGGEGG